MPQRITNISITVYRDGKRKALQPNTKFNFTDQEIKDIEGAHRGALRKPNSDQDDILDLTTMGEGETNQPKPEDEKKEVVDTSDKPLTAAEKKAQKKAQDAAKLAEEQNAGSEDEGL